MANYRIYTGSKRGKALGDDFELMQGSTESALIFEVYTEDDAVYNFAAGATIAGYFLDIGDDPSDPPDVYTTTGTITPDIGANTFTWAPSSADVGQPGDYNLAFKLIAADADADYTFPIHYKIRETPDGSLVPAVGLVGVTPAEAAWLTLAANITPTAGGNLAALTAAGNLQDSQIPASWNSDDMTMDITHNANVTGQVGQEMFIVARNNSGSNITDGQVVKLTGSISDRPTIALAQADSVANARQLGVATEDIDNNATGFVTVVGLVRGLNTNAYTEGDVLYLSTSVAGAFTATKPTYPDISIEVGSVVRKNASDGIILVGSYETGAGAYDLASEASSMDVARVVSATISGTTHTVTATDARLFRLTLANSPTVTLAAGSDGDSYVIVIIQDAVGSRAITWSNVNWGDAGETAINTGANDYNYFTFIYNPTESRWDGFSGGGFT